MEEASSDEDDPSSSKGVERDVYFELTPTNSLLSNGGYLFSAGALYQRLLDIGISSSAAYREDYSLNRSLSIYDTLLPIGSSKKEESVSEDEDDDDEDEEEEAEAKKYISYLEELLLMRNGMGAYI